MRKKVDDLYSKLRTNVVIRKAAHIVLKRCLNSDSHDVRSEARLFGDRFETNIKRIKDQLRDRRYTFSPARGLPKKRTGKQPRPLVIRSIQDKVVLRAILQIIQDKTESRLVDLISNPYSFGAIKGDKKGVAPAISCARQNLGKGNNYFIQTDIKEFFRNIPRKRALGILADYLSDSSLTDILEKGTTAELSNIDNLQRLYPGLYPSYELGVAQGCCLSPLLGNVLLSEYDLMINQDTTLCIRYIDDLLFLGPSKEEVWRTFKNAVQILHGFGLKTYMPATDPDKAREGCTDKSFDFLGCAINRDFISPNKQARGRLIEKLDSAIRKSKAKLKSRYSDCNELYKRYGIVPTLRLINDVIRAWGAHYAFCNSEQVMANLDTKIDKRIGEYLRFFDNQRAKVDNLGARRLLGVQLLTDLPPKATSVTDSEIREIERIVYGE